MLIVSADSFDLSRIGTVVAAAISSNVDLAAAPGNIAVPAGRRQARARRAGRALDHDTLAAQTKLGGYSLVTGDRAFDRAFDRAGIALALA